MSTKASINTWDWDVRVRERNVRHGIITDKDVEKMLHALPDASDQVESLGLNQPAMLRGDWDAT